MLRGIWDIGKGDLVFECPTQNGVPPQIRGIYWAPGKVTTEWISSSENIGPCDLICTTGERHLKFWSFARPKGAAIAASVKCCGAKFGKVNPLHIDKIIVILDLKVDITQPKSYLCAAFVLSENRSLFDVVTGGSNGTVYLWRNGNLIANAAVCRGPLNSVQVYGNNIYCGGAGGIVKVVEARTLSTLRTYNLGNVAQADLSTGSSSRASTPAAGVRPMSASRGRAGSGRPKSASVGARPKSATDLAGQPSGSSASRGADTSISALTICEDRRSKRGVVLSGIALTSAGVAIHIDFESEGDDGLSPLFYYHFGAVNGVARVPTGPDGEDRVVTCGEDKLLCVWNTSAMRLEGRYKAQSAIKSCDVSSDGSLIGVGISSGGICLLYRDSMNEKMLSECAFRKDAKEEISDVKFNPSGVGFAAASHDNFIYIYGCFESTPPDVKGDRGEVIRSRKQYSLRPLQKLRGHSSYITHIDWSCDGSLLRSNCGAYELLMWEADTGRICTGIIEADVRWSTHTCVLGFNVMGIWPKYSDGTDVNAVDVSKKKKIIATADDFGRLNIHNFPCVVSGAPRKSFTGHSSFVTCVRFNGMNDEQLVTTGGQDCCVIVWKVV